MPLRGNRRNAVGNREKQAKSILGLLTNDTYVYDDANRLTSLNGVTYTWDNNSNTSTSSVRRLLNDGVNTYTGVYPEPVEGIPLAKHPLGGQSLEDPQRTGE